MKEYTKLVNEIFSYRTPFELLIAKRYPGVSVAIFDVNSFITNIYNNPTGYLAHLRMLWDSVSYVMLRRAAYVLVRVVLERAISSGMMSYIQVSRQMRLLLMSLST
jgi:hypothetical protein